MGNDGDSPLKIMAVNEEESIMMVSASRVRNGWKFNRSEPLKRRQDLRAVGHVSGHWKQALTTIKEVNFKRGIAARHLSVML
jgi:hypothetical protein